MDLGEEDNMKFTDKELERMTKAQLIKHISDLYTSLAEGEVAVKNKGSIHFGGTPKWVKDHHDKVIRQARDERNG